MFKKLFWSAFFVLCFLSNVKSENGNPDDLLVIIGMQKTNDIFVNFLMQNGFNAKMENPAKGVKIYTDERNQYVKSLVFTNKDFEINYRTYTKYNGMLPLGVSLDDTMSALIQKLGLPIDTFYNIYEFQKNGYIVKVEFVEYPVPKIACVTYTKNLYKAENVLERNTATKNKIILKDNGSLFRKSFIEIFNSSNDISWNKIITGKSSAKNFWNYHYTWNTTVFIPGQLYNLVYAFPYENSQRDFVVVLGEDKKGLTKNLQSVYNSFKNKFQSEFPDSEGWVYSYEKNSEAPQLPDMKATHLSLGTVVLDYSKAPWGAGVVYLRFLFQYE